MKFIPRALQLAALCFAISTVSACSVYDITRDGSSSPGIPFYAHSAECWQETQYQEDTRRLSIQILSVVTDDSGKATEREVQRVSKRVRGSATPAESELRFRVRRLSSHSETQPLLDAFDSIDEYEPGTWQSNPNLVLTRNTSSIRSFVDYSRPYFFNASRPFIGTSSATAEFGPNGTLSKGSSETEDRTVETMLSSLALGDILSSMLVPAPEDIMEVNLPEIRADAYRAVLQVEHLPIQHTLARSTPVEANLGGSCPERAPIPAATVGDISYSRTTAATPSAQTEPENTLEIRGQIVLPEESN
ncbi:hypothetical protein [Longimonas halophila]|uniref:hypothetical protein n=1 Tax=Longimonas halophila TaxID=1469170 RepID=UPI001144D242|nr:hypothetical protein [Longimonas halophila]